ncbi:MAG: dihydrolipoyl dehydrogenase [Elusimicrobiaceae bacterium]|nr:dihydrolipoyl dehydrogenase [Elusimicrobiaceae bacterium]MBT3954884.1 dihydrolipoyl dehydrogenase [Elusimicrobiaceae bacterium]MBT4008369.1 dihydrolipoyl dehydrogenase [Elusimicrobiaceae bacterium]MBT4403106.1 dihydrolipoyl dehydrogenase [Elusimicrobiaceae bacterium]MBT4439450.1 dihydrolipoyl dehydrogenase [Elusimicrobiaceae bacterium]
MPKKIAIIGCGPAGYPCAFKLRDLGADVTIIEKDQIGGVCLNWGCIPSKSYLDSAHKFEIAKTYCDTTADWQKIKLRKDTAIKKLQLGLQSMIKAKNINYIEGLAKFIAEKELEINGEILKFDDIVIATGTEAFFPPDLEEHKDKLLDNKSVFNLETLPKSISIIGGGVIGMEFACLFNAVGVQVNVVELLDTILPLEDPAISTQLKRSLEKRNIKFHLKTKVENVSFEGENKIITLANGEKLESEQILVCVGRTCELKNLGLESVGIEYSNKGIKADDKTLKVKDNIYAIGDVNGFHQLAHAAHKQGEVCAKNIIGENADYSICNIPKVIYTWPEIASVGITKKEASEKNIELKTYKSFYLANGRAVAQGDAEGFLEIFTDAKTNKILGAHIIGASASEIIHIISVAVHAKMDKDSLKDIVFAHPSFSELIYEALGK